MKVTIADIVKATGAKFSGKEDLIITGVNNLEDATSTELAYLDNPKYLDKLAETKAGVVILREVHAKDCPVDTLIIKHPHVAYAKASQLFIKPVTATGIHKTAVIGEHCNIPSSVIIQANVVIGDNVELGENVVIYPGCVIGNNCKIGANTELKAHVTFYEGVIVGENCIFHSGCVIGSDGFGNANESGRWIKIAQLGTVVIGNDVEIGANTTVDRGTIKDTVIEDNVRIDNLVQVAHNVHIGAHTAIAGCVGIAGSAIIGKYCMIGGGTGINGHISICDYAIVYGMAMVTNSISEPGLYASGTGLMSHKEWQRSVGRFRQLDKLAKRIKELEDKIK